MALAVDTAGKVKANPNTGNVMSSILGKIGAGVTAAEVAQKVKDNKAANALKKGAKEQDREEVISQSLPQPVQEVVTPITSFLQPSSSQQYAVTSTPPKGLGSSTGATSLPTFSTSRNEGKEAEKEEDNDLSDWEFKRANDEGRDVRTTNYFGEQFKTDADDNGLDDFINAIDPYAKYVGNTEANDSYIRDAIANGLSEEDAKDIMDRADTPWWQMLGNKYLQGGKYVGGNKQSTGDVSVIDDGTTYDYDHMTSDNMTGTQYMHYVEMGMGGRPIEQIDPTRTYSKRREQINHGFIPFTPDSMSAINMAADDALDIPARLGSWVSNFRQNVTPDYSISYGDGNTISGRDYDKLSGAYLNQIYRNQDVNPRQYLEKPADGQNVSVLIREYAIPDMDGNETYHYGHLTGVGAYDDGTAVLEFSDGSDVDISQDYFNSILNNDGTVSLSNATRVPVEEARGFLPDDIDSLNDVDSLLQGEYPLDDADVLYMPDLVLSDGTRMKFDDAERIYWDRDVEDNPDDVTDNDIRYGISRYGIGPLSISNKPQRLEKSQMVDFDNEDGWFDPTDLADNAVDWTAGSLPISLPIMNFPWIYSLSNASSSLSGVDPGTYDLASDSYGLQSAEYDDKGNLVYSPRHGGEMPAWMGALPDFMTNQDSGKWWNALGNAVVPLTENIAGDIGSEPLKDFVNKMVGGRLTLPTNPTTMQVIGNALMDAAGEGVEEDIGNVFDEITQYGPAGMFADQALDQYGRPMYDKTGHEIRNYDTSLQNRFSNLINPDDLANSFAGGVVVDALMNLLPMPGYVNGRLRPTMQNSAPYQIGQAVRRDLARKATGVDQWIDPKYPDKFTPVSDEYASMFDNTMREELS